MTRVPTLEINRRSAHVAEVWLNRPDVRNAFNEHVIAELGAAFATSAATIPSTVASSDSAAQTSCTKPIACACAALKRSAVTK